MYGRLGRRRDVNQFAGARVRLEADTALRRADAFLRRHERAVTEAVHRGRTGLQEIGPELLVRIADTSNLYAAWGYLKRRGGQAPGPNGLRYDDLENAEAYNLLRTISSAIHDDSYRHGPARKVRHPKSSGVGHRTLTLENIEDRTIARAVVQITQPLLDPMFNDDSYGYRPGRSREHALLRAMQLTAADMFWVVDDVKDAFDNVPLNRLLDIVRLRLPCAAATWQLIERIIRRGMKRGLRQGNCLSPLLLNLYLDHCLDRHWSKEASDLIRYADDLLIICRTEQEALEAHDRLQQLLRPAGLQLKGKPSTAIRNLSTGETVEWSGYRISRSAAGFQVRIGTKSWNQLAQSLEEAHVHSGSPLYARETLGGWIDAQGATYRDEDQEQVVGRVDEICRELALEEAFREEHLLKRWRAAHARWCRLQQTCFGVPTGTGPTGTSSGGSASHVFSDEDLDPRCDGASPGAPSLLFATAESITLTTDGCCDTACKDGAWAAIIEAAGTTEKRSGYLPRTTNNRAELLAVIRGLELLPESAAVRLVTDSQYVALGISDRLEIWKHQGWRTGRAGRRKPLKNEDLWRRLDALLMSRRVTCDWVRGHAGHRQNEHADALAELALNRGRRQRAAAS